MKHYELFYAVSGAIPETQFETVQTELSSWISSFGGSVTKKESWGRKKLAYPINNEKHGVYGLVEFDAEAEAVKNITNKIKLSNTYLRHIITFKKPVSARELQLQEQAVKRAQTRAVREMAAKHTQKVTSPEKEESKIRLDELDKKLDELLDQDIVN